MVAVIKHGHSIRNVITYNENKVRAGVAECIHAVNYPKDLKHLTFANKLTRLTKQAALNKDVTSNSVHFSLNFDPSENLSKETLIQIADTYMRKLGMDDLPYVVYQHHDAAHPHIHIATVKVRANGDRVNMDWMGKNQSSQAREEIENEFGLIKAKGHGDGSEYEVEPVNVQKALYGRIQTKRAITIVLEEVIGKYKFTSLSELNSILSRYNVYADKGSQNSRVFKNGGLMYRMLDDQGNRVGVPIKASSFFNEPTLKELEKKFGPNEIERLGDMKPLKNHIDRYFVGNGSKSLEGLQQSLLKEKIAMVFNKNKQGGISGVSYVDHGKKSVFKGSDLGKAYGLNGIKNRFTVPMPEQELTKKEIRAKESLSPSTQSPTTLTSTQKKERYTNKKTPAPKGHVKTPHQKPQRRTYSPNDFDKSLFKVPYMPRGNPAIFANYKANGWIDIWLSPTNTGENMAYEFTMTGYKKKKKKKHST
ncbi:relaxase [Pedobacter sp. HMWF019]|uniref:relaxase/mobilization nuclease domain-containing protein n=1 Tax=Pedobacter sp. HMWF019 TaxID=2056856 RepID=UPI000D350011|nr:relaxase/mobilization nuclease domain-containing protein [Pedobacter sp. HMWF019]PTS95650.1 relaxase [Pedobacter sp. HMWF019]